MFAYAAAQVKKALEVSHALGAENYVFWGGREGYQSLLNTNYKLELGSFPALILGHCANTPALTFMSLLAVRCVEVCDTAVQMSSQDLN